MSLYLIVIRMDWMKGRLEVAESQCPQLHFSCGNAFVCYGLGAPPFFFWNLIPIKFGICNGMAAGVMLAASFDLIQERQEHGSGNWVVFGI
ncbi:putative zinc transporter [Camellia lanceoleosa]|uniref:Zinc transporter n=1 Tax=Camellia lanceoleosa TaxID=1840588 RepID=A0ACC0GR55_9ERIC|nr:putative zinc transporter [Camellia lanceoleosa]